MSNDGTTALLEIDAMKELAKALEPLAGEARERVLRWACDRYGLGLASRPALRPRAFSYAGPSALPEVSTESEPRQFESAAELLAQTEAATEGEKTLVIAYWYQVVLGQSDIESQVINTELKHLGHGVSNITRAFDVLMNQKPQPVIQLRKGGNSKQARKKYKLTAEGIRRVGQMLSDAYRGARQSGEAE